MQRCRSILTSIFLAGSFLFFVTPLQAQDSETLAGIFLQHYTEKKPYTLTNGLSMAVAEQVQEKFVASLEESLGQRVGYKAALTNKGAMAKLNSQTPVYGILLEKMLLKSGAEVQLPFGILPLMEGDLMIRVGSDSINTATNNQDLLKAIDAVIPFLELPDLMYAKGSELDGAAFVAANAGARLGVMGEPIPLKVDENTVEALGKIRVELKDVNGPLLSQGDSSLLLGHPLNVVAWLRKTLKAQGKPFKKGDLISLGSMSAMLPVRSPGTVVATYYGIPGAEEVSITVHFKE